MTGSVEPHEILESILSHSESGARFESSRVGRQGEGGKEDGEDKNGRGGREK